MFFSLTLLTVLSSVVSAVPFKRYDNETSITDSQSTSQDVTITIDKYLTTTLPATSGYKLSFTNENALDMVTSVVTEYVTETVGVSIFASPVSTYTTTIPDIITTSTLTNYVTVTENDGKSSTETFMSGMVTKNVASADACICIPSTVTVTATNTLSSTVNQVSTITSTTVTSFPVIGQFTLSGSTTKITSYVEITLTETSYTYSFATTSPQFSSFNNGTSASLSKAKRSFHYDI